MTGGVNSASGASAAAMVSQFGSEPPAGSASMAPTTADRAMAESMVQHGHWTQEQADAMLAGAESPRYVARPGASQQVEQSTLSGDDPFIGVSVASDFDRPASPRDYRFPAAQSPDVSSEQLQSFQDLAWKARMPVPIANAVFSVVDEHSARPMALDVAEMMGRKTLASLQQQYGEDGAARKLALGRRFINELSRVDPRVKELANGSVGCDPRFVRQILAHAERLYGGSE